MPEAAKALIDWGFQSFAIEKVFAWADARDRQSVRVMEKCGMNKRRSCARAATSEVGRPTKSCAACFVRSGSKGGI